MRTAPSTQTTVPPILARPSIETKLTVSVLQAGNVFEHIAEVGSSALTWVSERLTPWWRLRRRWRQEWTAELRRRRWGCCSWGRRGRGGRGRRRRRRGWRRRWAPASRPRGTRRWWVASPPSPRAPASHRRSAPRPPSPPKPISHTLPGSVPVVVLNSVWSVYYNRLGWASCRSASLGWIETPGLSGRCRQPRPKVHGRNSEPELKRAICSGLGCYDLFLRS